MFLTSTKRHVLNLQPSQHRNQKLLLLFRAFGSAVGQQPKDDEASYQFLEQSKTRTYHFQTGLLRLPIPKLEKTCARYLKGIRPFLSELQHSAASKLVKDFLQTEGPVLQKELIGEDRKNKHTNYISGAFYDHYLRDRVPVCLNHNPVLAFDLDPTEKYNDQLTRATNLVISIGRFKRSLDAEVLSPEVFHLHPKKSNTDTFRTVTRLLPRKLSWIGSAFMFKAFPLDMSQYPSLFNTSRIPVLEKDEIYRDPSTKHFVVIRKGHMFCVDLFKSDGSLHSPEVLHSSLAYILDQPLTDNQFSLGVLTTLERNQWAKTREELLTHSSANVECFSKLDGALFVLCLDELKSEDSETLIRNLLHSDGVNRWFDKSFSLILHGDGLGAVNFEHSWGDGVAVLRLIEEIYKDTCRNHWVHPGTKPSDNVDRSKFVQKLEFSLSENLKNAISEAENRYKAVCDSIQFGWLDYRKMSRDYIRKQNLGPDAIMQLAIQMAFYRQFGKTPCTYESCSTAIYRHGRTEVMRPATSRVKRCVQAFLSTDRPPHDKLRQMIGDCSKLHNQLIKEASMGQGFDRHLSGLDRTAKRIGMARPALFEDESYKISSHFTLSTSTLATDTVILGSFGPVVPDGYGIGYNVGSRRLGTVITGYPAAGKYPKEFAECMGKSLDDIFDVLEHSKGK